MAIQPRNRNGNKILCDDKHFDLVTLKKRMSPESSKNGGKLHHRQSSFSPTGEDQLHSKKK